jgi:hypothetical protein
MAEIIDVDPWSGATTTLDYDEDTERLIIKTLCDVQPVIDRNKELLNHWDGWIDEAHTTALVASIPITVAYKWLLDYGVSCWRKDHRPAVFKLLNDPDWRYLRCNHFYL